MFCPKCGSIMVPKVENGKKVLVCPKCGYKIEKGAKLEVKERVNNHSNFFVINEKEMNYPITKDVVCPKCGNREAYYMIVQTRSADEPPTKIYKCTKCGYVWREY